MADKANITPKVLKWARESARISLEKAAFRVSVSPEKLQEWEEGISQPTIRKAETLAILYKRPFALFFLPDIPHDFQPLQDFRRKNSKQLTTGSIFIIREIQQKQAWIREIYEENNEQPLTFVGRFSVNDDPKDVAEDIIQFLQMEPANYLSENPIKNWIEKAEYAGIFISRTSFIHSRMKLDSEEMQGFCLADKYAPFIFINSDDWTAPQLFTLVHELAHIWIAESGISNEIEPISKRLNNFHPIELFCNDVVAHTLMPEKIMLALQSSVFNSTNEVFKASKKLGVSSFAFLVRAFNMKLISLDNYKRLKGEAEREFQLFLKREEEKDAKQKEKKGGPDPYLLRLNKNSRLFTQIVLNAFRGGLIQPTQASYLLNTQVNKFSKLESFLYA